MLEHITIDRSILRTGRYREWFNDANRFDRVETWECFTCRLQNIKCWVLALIYTAASSASQADIKFIASSRHHRRWHCVHVIQNHWISSYVEEVVFSSIAARQKVCNVSQFDTDIPKFRSRLNPVDENIERCNPATPNFVGRMSRVRH